jgi:hypothetical protein
MNLNGLFVWHAGLCARQPFGVSLGDVISFFGLRFFGEAKKGKSAAGPRPGLPHEQIPLPRNGLQLTPSLCAKGNAPCLK